MDNTPRYNTAAVPVVSAATAAETRMEEGEDGKYDSSEDEDEIVQLDFGSASAVATSLANEILSNNIVNKTKQHYESNLAFIANSCVVICPEAITTPLLADNDEEVGPPVIKYPIEMDHIKIIFGHMSAERPDKSIKSKSTVTGYISSIKYGYRKNGVALPEIQREWFKTYSEGYKRIVAAKKMRDT